MTRLWRPLFGVSLLAVGLAVGQGATWGKHPPKPPAESREVKTLKSAAEVVREFAKLWPGSIPHSLMREAVGVAVIPHVVKAGFLIDGRFGRGVVLARQPNGTWSNPVFIGLTGLGLGIQAGIDETDLILVFKTKRGLDRLMAGKGKLTLGTDVTVAAGFIGREAEKATDARLRAEILSYSRCKGLFAGLSLEGAALVVEHEANAAFYGKHVTGPAQVLAVREVPAAAAVANLQQQLARLGPPPAPPPPPPPGAYGPYPPPPAPVPPPPARRWW